MASPRILFIAPSSFPIRNAEANVNAKVLKMLTEQGCIIDLVCRSIRKEHYPVSDSDLFFGKVNSIHEIAVDSRVNAATLWRHFRCLLETGYVYRGSDWTVPALKVCEELIARHSYDFIYTYNEPSELIGYILSKRHGIKWVATWNDPYVWQKYPAPYGQGSQYRLKNFLRRKLIAGIGKTAYSNLFPSVRLRDYMLSYMTNMTGEKTAIAPHIVTGSLLARDEEKASGDVLRIIHSGSLGVERDPDTFCAGLRLFLDQYSGAKIEFTFLGVFEREKGDYFSGLIERYGLQSHIRRRQPVKYDESIEIVRLYDICMLLEAKCSEGIFLPSKIADYIQAGKPVLALSPREGVIHDMYESHYIEYFADITSPESIKSAIEELYGDFLAGRLKHCDKETLPYSESTVYSVHHHIFSRIDER